MEDFVNSLPEIRQLTEERDQLLRANLQLAEANLALKPEIDALALNHQEITSRLLVERSELDSVLRQAQECESVRAIVACFEVCNSVRTASPVQKTGLAVLYDLC